MAPILNTRWYHKAMDITVVDIVVVAQQDLQHSYWSLGCIMKAKVGKDGHIDSGIVLLQGKEVI